MKFQEIIRKFYATNKDRKERFKYNTELIHACLGLSGETGEVIDIIKKHVAYGKHIDIEQLKQELGDCLHYLARIIDIAGFDMAEIEKINIEKLNKRYPKGYTNKDAIRKTEVIKNE